MMEAAIVTGAELTETGSGGIEQESKREREMVQSYNAPSVGWQLGGSRSVLWKQICGINGREVIKARESGRMEYSNGVVGFHQFISFGILSERSG
jgi:hypothetical protein